MRRAQSGTPGPVYIEYPVHVIQAELDVPPPLPPERYRLVHQAASAPVVEAAVKLIRAAKKPVLLVGHGVHTARAHDPVAALAQALACPVIQTSGGTSFIKGLEDRTFPYGFSPAAVDAVVTSDLCIAIGTELGEPVHYGKGHHWAAGDANRKWIYIERDPLAIGVNRPIDVPLVGDLRDVVPQLVDALKGSPRSPSPELDRLGEGRGGSIGGAGGIGSHRQSARPSRAFRGRGDEGLPEGRHDGARRRCDRHLHLDLFAGEAARRRVEPELRPPGDGTSLCDRRVGCGGQEEARHAAHQRFIVPVPHLGAGNGRTPEAAARLRRGLSTTHGVSRWVSTSAPSVPGSPETGVHWGKQVRFDKIAEGFGCHGEYVEREEDIGPAIARAFASGKPGVIHVPIDPEANSTEMPSYAEFRTWYAEGMQ